mmetsp:Transcript_77556/g.116590  ORF Transcript_77556/g.116590 Transcript_77556/m.116590 type:complete len:277 (+) Transcript_77556:88-918(+)
MPPSSSTVLFGSALLVAAAAASSLYSSKSTGAEITDIDEDEDYITAEEVVKIFDRLFLEMQAVLAQLSQTVQQIQMQGQQIPEKQLRMMLKGEFERTLGIKQKQVLDEYDMDDDCLEEATWEFLESPDQYPKVKISVERFQRLWENVSGEAVVGMRPGGKGEETKEDFEILSASKTIEAAEIYFDSLTVAMADLVNGFKAEGKDLKQTAHAQDLHMQFAGVANEKGQEALSRIGVTLPQFQKSVEANASDPSVGRSLAMMQMKQQKALMSMGVPTG